LSAGEWQNSVTHRRILERNRAAFASGVVVLEVLRANYRVFAQLSPIGDMSAVWMELR